LSIREYLSEDCVELHLTATTKKAAILELVGLLARGGYVTDRRRALDDMFEREAQGGTAIGRGIAFPHARSSTAKAVRLALGLSRTGVPFEAMDGEPARIIVLEIAPEESRTEQLRIMGRITALLTDPDFRRRLLAATSAAEVIQILESRGQSLLRP
jgi:fructose PTS system EIIBC or EIIC component